MADVFRRLILKPPAATPERLARLADALQEAIHAQNRLAARSPHVLRFVGALDQDERAFFVEHEPAAGISPRDLFDSAAPRAAEEQLLQTMAGLGDALAAAHTAGSTRPVVHGGLCPGVVLTGPDGLVRITDFGFAPAICKILGVESYLNLAVAPGADGAGVWEILGPDVADRDDRICAFVDPDKYGQESLASFELGSDIIAAGLVLYVLAEHVHAYLYFEPQAHRVVDMARMMGFGVPNVFSRKDLCESANPAVQVWRELVGTMLSRLPAQRPSAAQIVQRFTSVGPKVDLDAIKAQRWLSQLENLLEAKVWKELEVTVKERPQLKSWPKELLAQAQSLEARAREVMEREGQRAAFEAEQQTATKWFVRLQNAVKAEDWDAAQELLSEKPQIENWPEGVEQAVGGLAAKIAQVGILRKARAWEKVLQKTFEAGNWTGVGKLLAQRPALDPWPDDMRDYVASIESAYREHLEEQERERLRIAEQHSQATKWFERAKSLADKEQWRETLDWLARPPELEHWPEDVRAEADRLLKNCRLHLTDAVSTGLDAITETVRRHAASIVDEVVAQGLAGLVRPQRVETAVDLIMWAPPGTEADGRAQLTVRLRPPTEGAATPPIPGELDFVLKEDVVQLCGGQGKFREQVAEALPRQLASLQKTQLGAFEHGLHATVFAEAAVHAQLTEPASPRAGAVRIDLLGNKDAGTTLQVDLRWSDDTLSWAAADTNRLVAQALEIATAVTQRVVLADLLARSTMLNAYQGVLAVQLAATEQPTPGELPKSLPFTVNVSVNPAGHGEPVPLCDGTAVCDHVGRASCDVDVAAMESRLTQLVVQSQEQSRQSLADGFKRIARTAGSRTQVGAPKRSKTPVGEVAFDIKSKGGNPLVLKAAWNTNTFVYDLPADWEKQVQTLLGPAGTWPPKAAAMPPPVGAKQPVRPAAAAPRRKLVMWASLAGAGLIVVVGVVLFVSSRGKTALPPQPVPEPVPVVNAGAEPRPGTSTTGEQPAVEPAASGAQTPPVAVEPVPEEKPGGETTPPEPPPTDLARSLSNYMNSAPDQFGPNVPIDRVLRALVPQAEWEKTGNAAQFLAQVAVPGTALLSDFQPAGDQRASFKLKVGLKAGAQAPPQVFNMQLVADRWQPTPENADSVAGLATAAKTALTAVVKRAREDVAAGRRSGNLPAVFAAFDSVKDVLPAMSDVEDAAALQKLMVAIPPAWEQKQLELSSQGFAADGEADKVTGYPSRLKDGRGKTLLLVSMPPADELWDKLKGRAKAGEPLSTAATQGPDERPWRIFYVDSAESQAVNDFAQAATLAQSLGREVPTRDEWTLAALKLGGNSPEGMFDGLREWCADEAEAGQWACGGCTRTVRGKAQVLPAPPKNPGNFDDMWRWLTDPLVMQKRGAQFGDDLTGVRLVLRVK